jgi:NADH-quinone oxidoreductase subunit G
MYDVPADTNLLDALDALGVLMREVDIPYYCWHPKLSVDASCRMCQVEVAGEPKLQIACSTPVREGMEVSTRSERVTSARQGVMELLLVNHPLDCPICDQAGECDLQDFSWRYGASRSRSKEPRRALEKRVELGPSIVLDRERCILCRRCVRFCREITGTGELAVVGRADRSVIDLQPGSQLCNDYSMNVADICPVGALTTREFRFAARVWNLKSVESVCGGCARGCNIHIDSDSTGVRRYRPRRNDAVNDTWMCDRGRLSHETITRPDRLTTSLVRAEDGVLVSCTVDHAIEHAAVALGQLVEAKGAGVIAGIASAHATNEDLFVFKRLMEAMGSDTLGVAVPVGEGDGLLIRAEKAANAMGAGRIGFGDVSALLDRLRGGGIAGALIMGSDLLAPSHLGSSEVLHKLDCMVVLDTHQSPLLRVADIVLPTRLLAEKDGTITNCNARVQRVRRAVVAPPGAFDEGELIHRLGVALGLEGFDGDYGVEAASVALSESLADFAGTELKGLPPGGRCLASDRDEGAA